jgi:hypothetical protein
MPQAPRPNKKAMKIAYKILKVPKDLQQRNEQEPPERLVREWFRDSTTGQ